MSAAPLVLTFEAARRLVEDHASQISSHETETLGLLHCAGRILATPIIADRDLPPFPRATRDGYAVRASDLTNLPAHLKISGEIKAGTQVSATLNPGEAYSIMTGAPVLAGADAVVMVEYTSRQNGFVEITKAVVPQENIVAQGAEAKHADLLVDAGTRLNESSIALAASVGKSNLRVFLRPRIAILTTGDEIVPIESEPGPAQIRNSNSYSLAVQVQQAGGDPVILPIAPDEPLRLCELIEEGLQFDLLIITGGVSMGRYDLVEQVLTGLQAEFFFTGAKIQPGKPVVFGRVTHGSKSHSSVIGKLPSSTVKTPPSSYLLRYFFGLPGNPVSTMVTFELFARPMIKAMAGMRPHPVAFVHARVKSEIRIRPGLTRFLPAILSGQYADSYVELVSWQGSGDIAARARSNCYLVIPPDREQIAPGEWIAVMLR
jgi:molybdopterin molybdotransferase